MAMAHRGAFGHVYVARIGDGRFAGRIKVGFTGDVERRMRQLHGELIASAPGSFVQEQHLVALARPHRDPSALSRGREWFHDTALPELETAWERMFGVYTPMTEPVAS